MRSLSTPMLLALRSPIVRLVPLIWMGFSSTPIALNLSNLNLDFGGVTYLGAGSLGRISVIEDSPGEAKGMSFELAGVDPAYIALALDDAAVVQGTPVTIRTALLSESYVIVDAPLDWTGKLDTMSIVEDGETCGIKVTAESSAVDLLKGSPYTYSDADQQSMHPGDRAFDLVIPQSNQPVVWPTKDWRPSSGHPFPNIPR